MRSCTDLGVCQARRECDVGCDVFYTHVAVRGPSCAPQYPFAPGVIDAGRTRQERRRMARRWAVRVAVVLAGAGFALWRAGVLR